MRIVELQGSVGASPSFERKLDLDEVLKECPDYKHGLRFDEKRHYVG